MAWPSTVTGRFRKERLIALDGTAPAWGIMVTDVTPVAGRFIDGWPGPIAEGGASACRGTDSDSIPVTLGET